MASKRELEARIERLEKRVGQPRDRYLGILGWVYESASGIYKQIEDIHDFIGAERKTIEATPKVTKLVKKTVKAETPVKAGKRAKK